MAMPRRISASPDSSAPSDHSLPSYPVTLTRPASQVKDASERLSAYYGLWAGHFNRCEPAPMREIAELFLREATARLDCPEAVIGHRISGCTCLYFGEFAGAHDHFRKTVGLYDQPRHGDFA